MLPSKSKLAAASAAAAGVMTVAVVLSEEPPAEKPAGPAEGATAVQQVTVEEARGRARLLQSTYEATLHTVHRHYFDADEKDTIPARALEEVFRSADDGTGRSTRWIAVNTPPMNVDHAPREGFEAQAAKALGAGSEEYEAVEDGVYRRAGALTLFASCLRCHESGLTQQIGRRRVAALVVGIPLRSEARPKSRPDGEEP